MNFSDNYTLQLGALIGFAIAAWWLTQPLGRIIAGSGPRLAARTAGTIGLLLIASAVLTALGAPL